MNDGDIGILKGTSLEFCRLQRDRRKTKREEFGSWKLNPRRHGDENEEEDGIHKNLHLMIITSKRS